MFAFDHGRNSSSNVFLISIFWGSWSDSEVVKREMHQKHELHLKAITDSEPIFITERITQVKTDIYVTSFGPVSDTEMVSSRMWLPTQLHCHFQNHHYCSDPAITRLFLCARNIPLMFFSDKAGKMKDFDSKVLCSASPLTICSPARFGHQTLFSTMARSLLLTT